MSLLLRSRVVLALALGLSTVAAAHEPAAIVIQNPDGTTSVSPSAAASSAPDPSAGCTSGRLVLPQDPSLLAWVEFFADVRHMNFVVSDAKELENQKIAITSDRSVTQDAAWEAFLSALEQNGYALNVGGKTARLVKVGELRSGPVRKDPTEPVAYVTQLIQLEHVRVDDMAKIIQGMVGPDAKIVAYPPTNTLILTDTGANVRKVYQVVQALDVASPEPDGAE